MQEWEYSVKLFGKLAEHNIVCAENFIEHRNCRNVKVSENKRVRHMFKRSFILQNERAVQAEKQHNMVAYNKLPEKIAAPCPREIGEDRGGQRSDHGEVINHREKVVLVVCPKNVHHKEVSDKANVQRQILREVPLANSCSSGVVDQHICEQYCRHTAADCLKMSEFPQLSAENDHRSV